MHRACERTAGSKPRAWMGCGTGGGRSAQCANVCTGAAAAAAACSACSCASEAAHRAREQTKRKVHRSAQAANGARAPAMVCSSTLYAGRSSACARSAHCHVSTHADARSASKRICLRVRACLHRLVVLQQLLRLHQLRLARGECLGLAVLAALVVHDGHAARQQAHDDRLVERRIARIRRGGRLAPRVREAERPRAHLERAGLGAGDAHERRSSCDACDRARADDASSEQRRAVREETRQPVLVRGDLFVDLLVHLPEAGALSHTAAKRSTRQLQLQAQARTQRTRMRRKRPCAGMKQKGLVGQAGSSPVRGGTK
jgi:hypothetical protein